jgi:hypothetical protein
LLYIEIPPPNSYKLDEKLKQAKKYFDDDIIMKIVQEYEIE